MTSRTLRRVASATGTFALITAGVAATSTPASADPNPTIAERCADDVYPANQLTPGDVVTGLTTVEASGEPAQFTGTFKSTLFDDTGDLLVFELKGTPITGSDGKPDAGIWSGMSGSPVYANDGRLIGAVSYSFASSAPSSLAAVTPAADMYTMFSKSSAPANTIQPKTIKLSKAEKAALSRQGLDVPSSIRRLDPVTVIGAGGKYVKPSTLQAIARKAGQPVPRVTNSGGPSQAHDFPIVPGGNLAAADAYGSVASYAVGTATAICDGEVVGFGHPFDFAPSTKSIHGAQTVAVVADGAASYKLANLGAPSGVLVKDQLNGILGKLGLVPTYPKVSSNTNGLQSITSVPNAEAIAMVAATQAYRDAVVKLNQDAGGEAVLSWTIKYTRENGSKQSFTRSQRYSSAQLIGPELTTDVAGDIMSIYDNEFENVKIDDVSFNTAVNTTYKAYKVGTVEFRSKGKWIKRKHSGTSNIRVKAGKKLVLRINYVRADKKSKVTPTSRTYTWNVPKSARGANLVSITGNAPSGDEFDEFEGYEDATFACDAEGECTFGEAAGPASFNALIKQMKSLPRSDDVTADFVWKKGSYHRTSRLPAIVKGSFDLKVKVYK